MMKINKPKEILAKSKEDKYYRAINMLYVSLAVNIVYAIFEALCGYIFKSEWMGTLAFYYIVLSVIRFNLLKGNRREDKRLQWRKYRFCAIVMLLLTVVLFGIHLLTLYWGHSITYKWYMIYAVAAYTFYIVINAVRNIFIYRKVNNPIISASKALNFAVAAISLYSLQSAMITAFGNSESFKKIMGNCVGIGVFIIIICVSLTMMKKANKELRINS